MPADLIRHVPLSAVEGRCRVIVPAPAGGWTHVPIGEWALGPDEGFGDCHPHHETNYVLEGRLVVDCDGVRVEAGPGDVVRVPADHPAYYYAPTYARMVFVYGANPGGMPATTFSDRSLVAPPP